MINIIPLVSSWAVLAVIVLGLVIYRKMIASQEDDSLHVMNQSAASQQSAVNHKLQTIDKWGKLLTVIAFLYGLVVAGVYFYNVWNATPTY